MRRASWASLAISAVAAATCCSCSYLEPEVPPAGTVHLTTAQFATSAPGNITTAPSKSLAIPTALKWVSVALPNAVPRAFVPKSAEPDLEKMETFTMWYRMEVPASGTTQPAAVYLPRWHTYGYLAIYVNRRIFYSSMEDDVVGSFNKPLLVQLPDELAQTHGPLELVIRMDSVRATGGALSTIWLGPLPALRTMYESRRLLQNQLPRITSAIFLVLGVFALGFWWRRRHEVTQLLFFALSLLFYIRSLHYYIDELYIPGEWLAWLTVNSIGWIDVVTYFFAFRLYGKRFPVFERILIGAMTVASLLTMPLGFLASNLAVLSPLVYAIFAAVSLSVSTMLSVVAWRSRSWGCAALASILWLNLGLGIHDLLLQNWRTNVESIYLLPIGVIALFAIFLATVLRRYLGALTVSEKAAAVLEARLAERERELNESHSKLREIEQAQLLSQERQRLMRDMHDGLGSALMSSLIAVERGQMQSADIVQVLRECVDDLKLTIDSLEPVGDDLLILLATLRFRLENRLETAGIKLVWDVEPVPGLSWLNPALSLHILRIVQEILTNVLKHAHAQTIRIAATHDAEFIMVVVEDDGVGFDVDKAANTGRGLSNLRQRAAMLGATLAFESRPGGTRVSLRLPIRRTASG